MILSLIGSHATVKWGLGCLCVFWAWTLVPGGGGLAAGLRKVLKRVPCVRIVCGTTISTTCEGRCTVVQWRGEMATRSLFQKSCLRLAQEAFHQLCLIRLHCLMRQMGPRKFPELSTRARIPARQQDRRPAPR